MRAIVIFYGVAFLYELVAQAVLGFAVAKRRRLPEPPRYGNALIETSYPTIMMALLANAIGPEIALNSPLPMAYFVFICLSTLRMTASLSIFTGCVAGLEYSGLALYYLGTGAGEVRRVTIMFVDIRGFTTFAEQRTPHEVVEYLNILFGIMITLVNAHHGIINKFLGDGFMACFGAPLSDGRDTENAVRAALAIAQAVERLSTEGTIAPTRIGIGLHAGDAVTGSVGSHERREYTIIGNTVNLASRVEQLTKQTDSVLLVTEAVWQIVKANYTARPLAPVQIRGRQEPVALYALL